MVCNTHFSNIDKDRDLEQRRTRPVEHREIRRQLLPSFACSLFLSVIIFPQCRVGAFSLFSATSILRQRDVHSRIKVQQGRRICRSGIGLHRLPSARPLSSMHTSNDEEGIQTFYPSADRIVTLGDVHGDAKALRACLKMADLIDCDGNWAGGTTHLVQVFGTSARGLASP